MSGSIYQISKEWLEDHYLYQELSTKQCADIIGCGDELIRTTLIKYDIPRRSRNTPGRLGNGYEKYTDFDWLTHNYIDLKKPMHQMAKEAGCSYCSIRLWIENYGIPTRPVGDANRGRKRTPAQIARMKANHPDMHGPNNPRYGAHLSEETKRKIGAKSANFGPRNPMTGKKHTPEAKRKIKENHPDLSGSNNPRWLGGVSFGKYCPKFNKAFKEHIKDKFGRTCYLCHTKIEGVVLCIHHIDYNKNSICNGHEWAFVPLCRSHHTATNANRWYWFNHLINYWAMNPDINFNIKSEFY